MYGRLIINKKLKDIIPESEELSQRFSEIHSDSFDEDVRSFLNILNKTSDKIYSLVTKRIKMGNSVCQPTMVSIYIYINNFL